MQHQVDRATARRDLLSRKEAAEYLGVSENTLAIWWGILVHGMSIARASILDALVKPQRYVWLTVRRPGMVVRAATPGWAQTCIAQRPTAVRETPRAPLHLGVGFGLIGIQPSPGDLFDGLQRVRGVLVQHHS